LKNIICHANYGLKMNKSPVRGGILVAAGEVPPTHQTPVSSPIGATYSQNMPPRWGLNTEGGFFSVGFTHRYQYAAPNGAFNPFQPVIRILSLILPISMRLKVKVLYFKHLLKRTFEEKMRDIF
jgi:hypothetical protein